MRSSQRTSPVGTSPAPAKTSRTEHGICVSLTLRSVLVASGLRKHLGGQIDTTGPPVEVEDISEQLLPITASRSIGMMAERVNEAHRAPAVCHEYGFVASGVRT